MRTRAAVSPRRRVPAPHGAPSAHVAAPRRVGRDWPLALLGGGCCTLGAACLLLVACSETPTRPLAVPTATAPPSAAPVAEPPPAPPAAIPADLAAVPSPWPRLRQRFVMPGCHYNAAVRRWSRSYTESPARFEASLAEAMPYLLIVLDEIERRGLPGEFAFLPYIESGYAPLPASGDRAAGIWQLMPDTAREAGLRIDAEYDGRLDIVAATGVALDLIDRYAREFADWRLADMAYNAGEYGVKNVAGQSVQTRSAAELARLRINPQAHEHLAKLLAVACVVADPARFRVELPEPTSDDALAALELPAPVDFALAARLAGLEVAELRRLNPGYLAARMPSAGPYRLLVPAARRAHVEATLASLPRALWRDWHEATLHQAEPLVVLASAHELTPEALAAIHGVAVDATMPAGMRVLLPGRARDADVATSAPASVAPAAPEPAASVHVVHAGDTLWNIAQRRHVRLADLLRWNRLGRDATLHLGQRLRLRDTETAETGAVGAVGAR